MTGDTPNVQRLLPQPIAMVIQEMVGLGEKDIQWPLVCCIHLGKHRHG